MKKLSIFALLALCWSGVALAQSDDYTPLLREGVKWVYAEEYTDYAKNATMDDMNTETKKRLYTIELYGDTIIDNVSYKKVYRHSDDLWNDTWFQGTPDCSRMLPIACLREDGRTVYARVLNDRCGEISPWFNHLKDETEQGHEVILYDFQERENGLFKHYGTVVVGASIKETFVNPETGIIITEGLGVIAPGGELVMIDYLECRTGYPNDIVTLHHVEDADGNVIYKGPGCDAGNSCDVNGDGKVDVEDVNIVINTILSN